MGGGFHLTSCITDLVLEFYTKTRWNILGQLYKDKLTEVLM